VLELVLGSKLALERSSLKPCEPSTSRTILLDRRKLVLAHRLVRKLVLAHMLVRKLVLVHMLARKLVLGNRNCLWQL
jgi:hypothetical protein